MPKYKKIKKKQKGEDTDEEEETKDPLKDMKAYSRTELSIYFNQTVEINKDRKFIWFDTYLYKNRQYFIFMDNLDSFSIIDRQMNLKSLIKTREPGDQAVKINSVSA